MPGRWRIADALSLARLLLMPVIWAAALLGKGWLVGAGLLVAGLTDALDGYAARRLQQESSLGARLDSFADNLLLVSAMAWIELLHPEILRDNPLLVAAAFGVYLSSLAVGLVKFHQLGNLHLYSSKAAGGLLYTFAVITLLVGTYSVPLLWLAAAAFIVSSSETLLAQVLSDAVDENMGSVFLVRRRRADRETSQDIEIARKQRSHAPHDVNSVGRSASATSSSATSAAPNAKETRP